MNVAGPLPVVDLVGPIGVAVAEPETPPSPLVAFDEGDGNPVPVPVPVGMMLKVPVFMGMLTEVVLQLVVIVSLVITVTVEEIGPMVAVVERFDEPITVVVPTDAVTVPTEIVLVDDGNCVQLGSVNVALKLPEPP